MFLRLVPVIVLPRLIAVTTTAAAAFAAAAAAVSFVFVPLLS